jgi:ABC-2 type transport system ATP-binding protein
MSAADSVAVHCRALVRDYTQRGRLGRRGGPPRRALDHVDLQLTTGEVHGLLGPNGAGKTTLVRILATILLPTSGVAQVFGHDVRREAVQVRRAVGLVLGGERGHYASLTARENLDYWAAMYELRPAEIRRRVGEALGRVGLEDRADARVETFSRGMKQRLHVARGLLGDARLLVLDEPTTGTDPVAALAFRAMVRELNADGRTFLFTTHDMAEAEDLCTRVTLINGGRILATERPARLAARLGGREYVDVDRLGDELAGRLAALLEVDRVEPDDRGGSRVVTSGMRGTAAVVRAHPGCPLIALCMDR